MKANKKIPTAGWRAGTGLSLGFMCASEETNGQSEHKRSTEVAPKVIPYDRGAVHFFFVLSPV